MSESNYNETAIDAGRQIATLSQDARREGQGVPYLLLADGLKASSVEAFLQNPVRARTTVELRDAVSFVDYVKTYADANSLVFANIANRTITAVLDYHKPTEARWGSHRAQLTCLLTEDWKRWMAANKKAMGQVEFAQFLEDNLPNIAEPAGAEILEIAKTLEAKKSVNFGSSVRLDNGQHQLTYEETITGSASKGSLQIPDKFVIGVEPFEGAGLYRVDARLRYRVADRGQLAMWFDLVRPEAVVEDAFKRARQAIADGIAPVKVLAAAAPTTP